jgi:hypothetical protein
MGVTAQIRMDAGDVIAGRDLGPGSRSYASVNQGNGSSAVIEPFAVVRLPSAAGFQHQDPPASRASSALASASMETVQMYKPHKSSQSH